MMAIQVIVSSEMQTKGAKHFGGFHGDKRV
jgi:hypothetical protein